MAALSPIPLYLHYWFLLPIGLPIAVLVMSAGVSGATLWVPVYLLWLKLEAPLAFWLGLFTLLFGFGSGVYRNWHDGSYDGPLVRRVLAVSVPAALLGGWCAALINKRVLIGFFGAFLLVYSGVIATRTLRNRAPALTHNQTPYLLALMGGGLTGLISIGVGILAMPAVLRHRSIRTPGMGIGSLVMIIFFTSMAAAAGRLRPQFIVELHQKMPQLIAIMIWAAPAVIIGGQIGPRIAQRLPSERHARLYFSAVLIAVGLFTLWRAYA
ncbi:MAG: sulfite exporter TauE/SafE family protein [Candidatus Binataceae bacterium]